MSDEILTPEEAQNTKLVSANASKNPLIPGHRDAKVIYPLSLLQDNIKKVEKDVRGAYNHIFEMMQHYGHLPKTVNKLASLIDVMDVAFAAITTLLEEKGIITKEEFAKKSDEIALGKLQAKDNDYNTKNNLEVVEREAQEGDTVCIDFKGKLNNEYFEGGEANFFNLRLGSNSFVGDFEKQLIGTKAGDAKEISIAFPPDYGAPQLAGKEAIFEVTVHSVKQTISKE